MAGAEDLWSAAVVVAFILGNYWFFQATRHLAEDHPDSRMKILLWSKLFAARENFSPRGLDYRRRALVALAAFFGLLAVRLFWLD